MALFTISPGAALHLTLVILYFVFAVTSAPLLNITIEAPDGTTTHDVSDLLCVPPKWTDIAAFYIGNYIAHIATIKPYPGEKWSSVAWNMVMALLFPVSGIDRAFNSILRCSAPIKNSRQQAARSGALCMVVRRPGWKPRTEDFVVENSEAPDENPGAALIANPGAAPPIEIPEYLLENSTRWPFTDTMTFFVPSDRKVYGDNQLPEGYQYAHVPRDAIIDHLEDPIQQEIFSTYSLIKPAVALVQSLYASYTVYSTRGDQINRYGYASFGLTVAPYAVMSALNLLGTLTRPSYDSLFLVHSEVMDEAKEREGRFDYVVGRVRSDPDLTEKTAPSGDGVPAGPRFARKGTVENATSGLLRFIPLEMLAFIIVQGGVFAIIGGLSHFNHRNSTVTQRTVILLWLACSSLLGSPLLFAMIRPASQSRQADVLNLTYTPLSVRFFVWFVIMIYSTPAIAMFAVVGKMLKEYGSCIRF